MATVAPMFHARHCIGLGLCRFLGLACLICLAPQMAQAQDRLPKPLAEGSEHEPEATELDEAATATLVSCYKNSEHWLQQAVLLLSLNHYWAPKGSEMVLDALQQKDTRLRALGLETLLRCEHGLLPKVVSPRLLEELIKKQLNEKNPHFKQRLQQALDRIAPTAKARSKAEWNNWWQGVSKEWQPQAWQAKSSTGKPSTGRTVLGMADRASNLHIKGLDLAICIDSTSKMQPTINAIAKSIGQMTDILQGISPKLRLALVHYKDKDSMGKVSADVIIPLHKNIRAVHEKLLKLPASGGNMDPAETVWDGMNLTLNAKLKWRKDSNKLVLLVSDAPCHSEKTYCHPGNTYPASKDYVEVLKLVREAYGNPGKIHSKGHTGPIPEATPFITATIGVSMKIEPEYLETLLKNPTYQKIWERWQKASKNMREQFTEIAQAGGGVYKEITYKVEAPPPLKGSKKDRKKAMEAANVVDDLAAAATVKEIINHIMVLSFGTKYRNEMETFVQVYYDYKDAGFIRK